MSRKNRKFDAPATDGKRERRERSWHKTVVRSVTYRCKRKDMATFHGIAAVGQTVCAVLESALPRNQFPRFGGAAGAGKRLSQASAAADGRTGALSISHHFRSN